jgi:hypothetical protein
MYVHAIEPDEVKLRRRERIVEIAERTRAYSQLEVDLPNPRKEATRTYFRATDAGAYVGTSYRCMLAFRSLPFG